MSQLPPSINSYSPGVQSLLPLFYVAWADRVLSPSEVRLLRSKIKDLKFLSKEDKVLLQKWSDPRALPNPQIFHHWKIVLQNAAAQLDPDKKQSFADLGFEMAKRTATEGKDKVLWAETDTRKALQELEEAIGGVSSDTYHTIFPKSEKQLAEEKEPMGFDPKVIQELLDSDSPEMKRRMRVLLSDPLFRYKTLRVKEDYRNQVLEWTIMLANQGMGALAYPKEYGGVDDMRPYSAVFEMLGYHDVSLAIKFGVQFGLWGGAIQRLGTKKHHDNGNRRDFRLFCDDRNGTWFKCTWLGNNWIL